MNRPRRPAGTAFTTPALAAVLCATTLLAGCTPPTPTPTPRPTPTWQCTPEAGGGTPKPCTEYEHREM